jgi:putative DNA methylase
VSDEPRGDLAAVVRAYEDHLDGLARKAIEAPHQPGETPGGRTYAAIDAAKDAWQSFSEAAFRYGAVIEAGEGRARFYNVLAERAVRRWGTPPQPVNSAISWQRTHREADPNVDTEIISWFEACLVQEWLPTSRIGSSGTAVGSTAEVPVPAEWEHEQPRGARVSDTGNVAGMPTKRKLIEVALPLEAINVASAREKSIRHGHPSTLHLWWARRPLAACRAVLFASLVDDPSSDPDRFPTPKAVEDERTRLFGIIERLVLWENTTNEVVLEEARAEIRRSTGGNPPPVLDPFCGGGSIPLEAQRLGLTAYASDLNPVAVLITKALIEIPPKFANMPPVHPDARRGVGATGAWKGAVGLAEDVRRYGAWMRDEAERRIGHLYPKVRLPNEHGGGEATVIAWLWARTVTCPNPACGAQMPLVGSYSLAAKPGGRRYATPVIDRVKREVTFDISSSPPAIPDGTIGRRGALCLVCGSPTTLSYIRDEGRQGRMTTIPLAVVADSPAGRLYLAPTSVTGAGVAPTDFAPELISANPRDIKTQTYGLRTFGQLFTSRQATNLGVMVELAKEVPSKVAADAAAAGLPDDQHGLSAGGSGARAYGEAVAVYLAFAIDRLADRGSTLATWDAARSTIRNTFSRQAMAMSWDFAEGNPFSHSTGNFGDAVAWVCEALADVPAGPPGSVVQRDAAAVLDVAPVVVSTDPPYYDNIGYSDLSDYFYIWLRRSLSPSFPSLFSTMLTPKGPELVATPTRFDGDRTKADQHFEQGLRRAFGNLRAAAHLDYPVTVYYAFKQAETQGNGADARVASTGWETMLDGLLGSGLAVVGTWPIRTELSNKIGMQMNMLASSIVLVCRPRADSASITDRRGFLADLKAELPDALRTLQHGNIAPVDLAQASIGPGMAVFSGYAKVVEPDGTTMSVRTALALINGALDELLTEQEGEFDADTRWAIAWYDQFGLDEADSGRAILLTQAKDTSLEGLAIAGIVEARRGKTRLLDRSEYSVDWDPAKDRRTPVWEAMQRLIQVLLVDGEAGAAALLARLGGLGDTARDLAYRLYHVAERKGWTDEARAYNALVVAWPDLARGADSARAAQPAQATLGLE